jgi:hypothetical protein
VSLEDQFAWLEALVSEYDGGWMAESTQSGVRLTVDFCDEFAGEYIEWLVWADGPDMAAALDGVRENYDTGLVGTMGKGVERLATKWLEGRRAAQAS